MKLKRTLSRNLLIAFALISAMGILAFTSKGEDPIEKIVAALQRWTDNSPVEKVYLHTDKPNYVVGDTIWFKAYVTTGAHQLSALSGAVYVDLITESDSLAQSIKLPVTAGMAMGEFVLPDSSMREGNYRIRAYTQWMRNAGPEYFYDKIFTVGNSVVTAVNSRIDFEYSGKGKETVVTAVLGYDDENGKPYVGKSVKYSVLNKGKVLNEGKGTTDAKGELRVIMRNDKNEELRNAHVNTTIELDKKETVVKTFPVKIASINTDVQFFPEGGELVNGVRSKVGFKATGTNGLGVPVKGIILDEKNAQISEFETEHAGMGFFLLAPETGKSYKAKVTYPDGTENLITLPVAKDAGYVLSVYNNPDTILVRISAHPSMYKNGEQHFSLVVQSGGVVMFASDLAISRATTSVRIPAKEIITGIAQFTLFSPANMPLNERIAFIQNDDQAKLKLNSAKKVYAKREKIEIDVDAADSEGKPIVGNYSAAVINEDVVPVDEVKEQTIMSHLLLSSDINGYIENPNYYFFNPSEETKARLDLLMLTQGYRRFLWKDLLTNKPITPEFKKEGLITEVTGRLMTLANKPLAGGKVKLFNVKLGLMMDTVTDANGRFKFSNLLVTTGVALTLQGRTATDGKKVEVLVDRVAGQSLTPGFNIGDLNVNISKSLASVLENNRKQDKELERFGRLSRVQELREVVIRSKKKVAPSYGLDVPEGHSDQTVKFDKPENCPTLLDCMRNNIANVSFRMDNSNDCGPVNVPYSRGERMRIVVNGRLISDCEFQDVLEMNSDLVERIEVVRTNQALISRIGGTAIIIITKTRGTRSVYNPSVVSFQPSGFSNAKQFYVPKYDAADVNPVTDLRTTVYWNPSIITDANGKAKLSFYNSDGAGHYRVVVEGIDASGLLGRQVYQYQVK
ncbi:carboxypeptidase-like regulatory domain-containing protein [Pedobacter frigoris]|uniref:TonB-dependent receptor n=1 Tax=Pedobacter frigoris TaxID=2571272 RepID=A0A4U1CJ97_9SPHI|nr:carboxypeptidase-like regulatory domain-containing protein [Pedobacter frigoris]TKC06156.1 TonB-dependent receptor [Pedobacter frigoris]